MNKDIKSLYIHIPFCNKICDYCDFTKLQYFRNFAVSYLKALEKELASYDIRELKTIYVGGGTPTALEDDLFFELLEIIYPYSKEVEEYTFEANPESLTLNKIKLLRKYGVNRISIGVQTTDDEILRLVNRDHCFSQVVNVVHNLKKEGIENINVDLILGLPHTSERVLKKDIANILSLDVNHISCYGLTVHEHTALYNKGFHEPSGDLLRKYYDIVEEALVNDGFIHYEVSNWAKPGYESKHNYTYWKNEQYFGVGLGASGYIDDIRYKNTINLTKYLSGQWRDEEEVVTKKDKLVYQIMLNLRTIDGLDLTNLQEEFAIDLFKIKKQEIETFVKEGYLIKADNKLIATYQGMMILDQIILSLLH